MESMRHRTPAPVALLIFLLMPVLVGACSVGPSGADGADEATGDDRGQRLADDQVRVESWNLSQDLENVAWLGQRVYLEAQVPAGDGPGGDHQWQIDRSLLASTGSAADGFELTVRIRVQVVPGNTSDWNQAGEATVARCFAFTVYDDRRAVVQVETECPAGDPIAVDTSVQVPARPGVGDADRAAIRRWLRSGATSADVADLQAGLSRGLTARATEADGATGVAVTARPDGDDCAVGLRDRAGRVEVWHPGRMVTMPGEYGCVPMLAIDPPAPPH